LSIVILLLRKWVLILAGLAAAVVLTGCKTDVNVRVHQIVDGSGEVTVTLMLDREAAEQSGDLRKVLRTADLEAAGWTISGPVPRPPGGRVAFALNKPFRNAGEAQLILTELTGEEGPFGSLVIDRTRSPLRIVARLTGSVDLTKGYQPFGAEVIARQFQTDSKLGLTPEDFQKRFNKPIEELVPLHLDVDFAGTAEQRFDLKSGEQTPISIRTVRWNRIILFPMIASALGLIGLLISFRRRDDEYYDDPYEG
jgi:hypothetical protein